jgi:hypothetical protein
MVTTATRRRVGRLLPPLAVGVIAFVTIRQTMLPGVDFWDTGELQTIGPLMGTAHPTGFPTYVLLAWLANLVLTPFGEPALRMNLLAALCVAVAAAVTVDLTRALTRSMTLGVMAGLGLAFTEIVWSIGTHAEAHALHLALIAILFRLLVAWDDGAPGRRTDRLLVLAAVVFGLAVGNHSLTLLLAPAVGLFVFAVEPSILRRPRFVATCAIALVATVVIVFLELPLRAGPFRAPLVYGRPETWDGFWYIALAEQFRGSFEAPFAELPTKFASLVDRTVAAFGPLAALIPVGLVATIQMRPRYALLSGVSVAATCFFAASYDNADIGRYYLVPALIVWTWLAILAGAVATAMTAGTDLPEPAEDVAADDGPDGPAPGAHEHGPRRLPRLSTLAVVAIAVILLIPTATAISDRAARVDRSGDTAARRWLDGTLASLPQRAVIVSWWSYSTPLWYAQHVEGQRPDVTIIDDRTRLDQGLGDIYHVIDANLATRPVYAIRADPREMQGLQDRYILEPVIGADGRIMEHIVAKRDGAA